MGRKSRLKRERRQMRELHDASFMNIEGFHASVPIPPGKSVEEIQSKITAEYQKNIKASPVWDEIVKMYGEDEAENILKEFEAKIQ